MQENALTTTDAPQKNQKEGLLEMQKAPLAIGLPVFICVLLILAYASYWTHQWLQDEQRLPVQEIVFSGNLNMLNEDDLAGIIQSQLTASFFALDVNEVHALMEAQSWVYSASIRKRWPSKLYIHIIEQKVVAAWNGDLLLNQYGDTFDGGIRLSSTEVSSNPKRVQQTVSKENQIPQLFGPVGSEKTVLTGYTHMQRLLNASKLNIEQLVLSERFAWQAKLSNQVALKLGRREYINRLQRFIDVYPLLSQQERKVEYVDLRYDTGLAVGWKAATVIQSTNNNNS